MSDRKDAPFALFHRELGNARRRQLSAGFELHPVPLSAVGPVDGVAFDLSHVHHLSGMSYASADHVLFGLQIDHGIYTAPTPTTPKAELQILIDHTGLGLLLAVHERKWFASAWINDDRVVERLLDTRRARLLFFRGRRLVAAFDASWSPPDADIPMLEGLRRGYLREAPWMPFSGHWRGVGSKPWQHLLSIADRAAAGWAEAYDAMVGEFEQVMLHLRQEVIETDAQPPSDGPLARAYRAVREGEPWNVAAAATALIDRECVEPMMHRDLDPLGMKIQGLLLAFGTFDERATGAGLALPHIARGADGLMRVNQRPIDLDAVERKVSFADYWRRISKLPRFYWQGFVEADDVPALLTDVEQELGSAPLIADVAAAHDTTRALLEEARSERRWCIPPDAVVELKIGPYVRADVREEAGTVAFLCRTRLGEFCPYLVLPEQGFVFLPNGRSIGEGTNDSPVDATMAVLLASIVRDFWVTEDRRRAFGRRVESRPSRRGASDGSPRGPLIVYLPRVHYDRGADIDRCAREIGLTERRAHFVTAHLRRSRSASQQQLALAALYGWTVPEGFTFVRRHQRGLGEAEIIYRSRSAQAALYEAAEVKDVTPPADWFGFEASVRDQLATRQLDHEQVRPLVRGPGVAIVACSRERDDAPYLIHALWVERVGPGLVNELLAALAKAPPETRGIIMTSGVLSKQAREAAGAARLEFVERVGSDSGSAAR